MRKALVFGTFDGLHLGHLNFLKHAKRHGNYLVVVVARDKTVKKIKNHFPLKNENERLKCLQKCKLVNETRLGYEKNPYKIIKEINPDVICLGYDQRVFTENLSKEIKKMSLKTKIYRLKPFKPEKYHSSLVNKNKK